jgi:HSP20 family protein
MSLIRWNPNRELGSFPSDILSMQREINRMFDTFFRGSLSDETALVPTAWTPAVDIAEHENEYVVKMEIPGVDKSDVKITMHDNVLTVSGEKKSEKKNEKESKGSSFHRIERAYGAFERSFALPSSVKTDSIDAVFKDGILMVTLPKSEQAKPKQIEVRVK